MVVSLNEAGTEACTEDLSKAVTGDFAPWESTVSSERDCDSTIDSWKYCEYGERSLEEKRDARTGYYLRTQMGTRNTTSGVNTSHNTDTPSVRNGEVRTLCKV